MKLMRFLPSAFAPKPSDSDEAAVVTTESVDDAFVLLAMGHLHDEPPEPSSPTPDVAVEDNGFVVLAGGFTGAPLSLPGETQPVDEDLAPEGNPGNLGKDAADQVPGDPDHPVIDVHDPHLESFGPLPDAIPENAEAAEEQTATTDDTTLTAGASLPGPYQPVGGRKGRRWPWSRESRQDIHISYDHDWGHGISVNEEEALRQRLMEKSQPQKTRKAPVLAIGLTAAAAALLLTAGSPAKVIQVMPDAARIVSRVQNELITRASLTIEDEVKSDPSLCSQQPNTDGCFTNNVIRAAAFVCPTAMHPIAVEFASSPVRAAVGLSHRPSMAPSTGFATVLSAETTFDFMTRDLNFAVDLISFRRNGTVAGMLKNVQPRQQLPVQVAKADGIIAMRGNEIERLALTPDCRIAIFENGIPPEYFSQEAKVNNSPARINVKPQTQAQADLRR